MIPRGKPDTKFLYPAGGCEQFARNLVTMIEAAGGKVHCGRAVDAVKTEGNRVVSLRVGRRTFKPSTVVWTGTIHSLAHVLGLPRPDLRYLALICYNILLTDGERFPFQWCYHGTPDVSFSRVSIPENFDAANTPPGRRSMCVEVTCAEGDRIWEDPMSIADRLINDMKRESLLKADREIIDGLQDVLIALQGKVTSQELAIAKLRRTDELTGIYDEFRLRFPDSSRLSEFDRYGITIEAPAPAPAEEEAAEG